MAISDVVVRPRADRGGYSVSFVVDAVETVCSSDHFKRQFLSMIDKLVATMADEWMKANEAAIRAALTPECMARAIADGVAARIFNKEN